MLPGSPQGEGHPPIMNVRRSAAVLAATVVIDLVSHDKSNND